MARHRQQVRRLSARVTEDAGRGWDFICETNGVTYSAVVEATGRLLYERRAFVTPDEVVELTRKIDHERTKRR
jgi:hypothetical protein